MKIEQIDVNFSAENIDDGREKDYYSIPDERFLLFGLNYSEKEEGFYRVPGDIAEKTNAGNDLCGNTRGIRGKPQFYGNEHTEQGGHGSAEADQNMRPKSRGASVTTALDSDKTTEQNGQNKSDRHRNNVIIPEVVQYPEELVHYFRLLSVKFICFNPHG